MSTWNSRIKRSATRVFTTRKLAPMVEIVENRQMLDGGAGVIAGTAFLDPNGTHTLGTTSQYLPYATIELFKQGGTAPIASRITDANGGYSFDGLAAGNYTVVEIPPVNYSATGTQILSQFQQATATSANSINVTVSAGPVYLNYGGVLPADIQRNDNIVDGKAVFNAIGPFTATLGTAKGQTDLSDSFLTFCLNDLHDISIGGGEQFQVIPQAITDLTNNGTTISPDRAGRIAFLYNHFGNSSLTNISGPALQLAIWELLYDTSPEPDFSAGNFQVVGPESPTTQATLDQVLAQASTFFNQSAGKSEAAIYLNDSPSSQNGATFGFQSMIATGSYDFGNKLDPAPPPPPPPVNPPVNPQIVPASISGFVYCDMMKDGVKDPGDAPIVGTTITLTGTDSSGSAVNLTTVTDATGAYHFLNLKPGVYTVGHPTQPAGYTAGPITQGTPGTGSVGNSAIVNVHLAAGVNGQNNNFAEETPAVTQTNVQLYGIHQQQSQIVLSFSGPLDPASAQNPANYKLIWLGKSDRYGAADNQAVAIRSATYNPSNDTVTLTPVAHLNIHYHYVLSLTLATADSCGQTVTSTSVFGRSSVPVFNWHGTEIAPFTMTPAEIRRDAKVVSQTKKAIATHPVTVHHGGSASTFLKTNPTHPAYGNGWSGSVSGNRTTSLSSLKHKLKAKTH